jgi:hypothetical protein
MGIFGTNRASLHLVKPKTQEEFLSNLTQFSQGNSVLDSTSSKTDDLIWGDTCVSSTYQNKGFWHIMGLSPS